MSTDELSRKGQDILQIVSKAKEFTEDLLKENERLRFKIASLEASGGAQAADERVQALQAKVSGLEEKLAEIEARFRKVEEENKEFADRYIEIEEQNNNLANLYVASYQLHSTLDFREVVRIVQEIVINLIGAEVFHVLMVSEKTGQLEVEASEGQTPGRTTIPLGDGLIGKSAQSGDNYFAESVARTDPSPFEEPIAVIPLRSRTPRSASSRSTSSSSRRRPSRRWTTSCSRSSPATPRPRPFPPSSTRPRPASSRPCRASWTC